jgi:phosphoglycerate kinase
MPAFKTLDDLAVAGRTVLVRGDLNVPTDDGGRVTDATRLVRLAPTLTALADRGAKVVVLSHFGRPKGGPDPKYSLEPVAEALARAVGRPVGFAPDCIGPAAEAAVRALPEGGILVLENLRFHPEEEKNDPGFARRLAALGDLYVNDAFSAAHRAHASTEALAHLLPAAAGRLMQEELEALGRALEHPERPLAAVVGGAKISTKLDLLGNLVEKTDRLVLGGGMANTFLHAAGTDVGASLCEKDMAEAARAIAAKAKARGCALILPVDAVLARKLAPGVATLTAAIAAVPGDAMILDIGPRTIDLLKAELGACRTVVWNGPLGAFEVAPFDRGTTEVAREVARLTRARRLASVAGGGDTVAALARAGVEGDFSYVSAAGGAFLEWLEGKSLPGVAALTAR